MSRTLLALSLAGAVGVDAVALGWCPSNRIYAYSVPQFLARPLRGEAVRVQGYVVHGSLCRVEQPCEYRFKISDWDGRGELPVRYASCIVSDTFGEIPGLDFRVTVEGELGEHCQHFEASEIFVRDSGKYEYHPLRAAPIPACPSPKP